MRAGDDKKSALLSPLSSICLCFLADNWNRQVLPHILPLLPRRLQEVAGISEELVCKDTAMGWLSGPASTLKQMGLMSHTMGFRPGRSPKRKLLKATTHCYCCHVGRFTPLLALTLLLLLLLPYSQPQSHSTHPTFSSPSQLLFTTGSVLIRHLHGPTQSIHLTHDTHSLTSKNAKLSHLSQQQPDPPVHPSRLCLQLLQRAQQ